MPSSSPAAEPYDALPSAPDADTAGETWARGLSDLESAHTYWLSTLRADGPAPHTVPLLAVVVGGRVHFSASATSRKARNLQRSAACTLAASGGSLDLVLEGTAVPTTDPGRLSAVAAAYAEKYGWAPEARDGALWAEGAPTAGPPPYHVYEIRPERAFGFPTVDDARPTRWRFPDEHDA
ncbi:pyridoxamine 5'-phosphate oxidase family protein [Spiractinospora alimapuensis]|uniref:pyridoxamine 5'-phosphate oxidase family protein n=1 Tax=Spiractinospora alimapuensis TaxID=2820884 RepID=UPI001F471B1A|nr:pyridoxamine 5'-phosphate oxidase family protein [Spiractinospora alimapuensis]QVQ50181.1 pyridoxamine 5'-phosphate oxidase family protein [Spiractinospora alimapuensis]